MNITGTIYYTLATAKFGV